MARPSILYEQESEFAQRNTFLYFVLGLIAVATRLLAQLRAEAATSATQAQGAAQTEGPDDAGELTLRDLLR